MMSATPALHTHEPIPFVLSPDKDEGDPRLEEIKFYTRSAKALRRGGQFEKAIRLLWQGLDAFPEHPRILGSLGEVYLAMRNPEKARDYFRRADDRDPFRSTATNGIARTYEMQRDIELARRWYAITLDFEPENHGARTAIARLVEPQASQAI